VYLHVERDNGVIHHPDLLVHPSLVVLGRNLDLEPQLALGSLLLAHLTPESAGPLPSSGQLTAIERAIRGAEEDLGRRVNRHPVEQLIVGTELGLLLLGLELLQDSVAAGQVRGHHVVQGLAPELEVAGQPGTPGQTGSARSRSL
jgi:hypothetical protein